MVPFSIFLIPNKASTISVLLEPTNPAIPSISPFLNLNPTSLSPNFSLSVSPSTSNITSPGLLSLGGNLFDISLPTIILIIISVVSSDAYLVPIN